MRAQYMYIEIQKLYTILQWLYAYYIIEIKSLDSNNDISIYIIIAMRPKWPTTKRKRFSLFIYGVYNEQEIIQ